jgi:uncharacterized protein (TIGR02145 family)
MIMKKILSFIAIAIIGLTSVVAQQTVTLTFTGRDQNNAYVRLDHVTIENLTRNWSETIWFPDTVYTLTVGTGVEEYYLNGGMQVMPNPFNGRTLVNIHSTKDEKAVITVVDINGKKCAEYNGVLSEGDNYFEIQLTTPQTYILSVQTNEGLQRVKMVNTGRAAGNRIEPLGGGIHPAVVSLKSTTAHSFELGDEMRFQGYTLYFDSLLTSAPVTQSQSMDEEITLVFDIPNLPNLTVTTDSASNVTETSAMLHGSISNPDNVAITSQGFEWKATEGGTYTQVTASGAAMTYALTGLTANNSYTYKAFVTYGETTAFGEELTFTTLATVTNPTITTDSATNVTETSATLHGSISNPDNVTITAQGFEWKATEGGTYTQVTASGISMTYELTGLTTNTSYTYRAFVSYGETTAYGEELTFTTFATVTNPTVTTDSATNVTETSAMLHGSISNPDNVIITAQGFEWKTTEGGTYTQVTASGTAMTYALTGLTANTSYTYKAFVSYGGTTAYGGELTFTTLAAAVPVDGQPCPGAPTLTDYDGNVYNTVQIGNQCWMKENLRTTHYSDGTAIPAGTTASSSSPYYYDYSSSSLPLTLRGYFYNWPAVMHGESSSQANPSGVQGICPTGWHVPSDAEWTQLTNYVSSQSDYVCGSVTSRIAKALAGTTGWTSSSTSCAVGNNQSTNNTTGFSALPAGYFSGIGGGGVCYTGTLANFWSTTQFNYNNISYLNMQHNSGYLDYGSYSAGFGCSVRCLRN